VPHRGTPNEPAYVMDTLRAVALVRGVSPEELTAQVEANADAAYAIPR
jgi:Tat protein secretion system quality control protein TatD with DNase activity